MSAHLSRYGVAGLAAGAWLLLGIESVLRPGQHDYRDALWLVPWLLTAAALRQLHLAQRSPAARLERWSYWAVLVAMTGCVGGNLGLLLDIDALEPSASPSAHCCGPLLWCPSGWRPHAPAWSPGTSASPCHCWSRVPC
jgi:hypothetical protein